MRIKRGSLRSTKIKNTVYVLLSPEQTRPNQDQTSGGGGGAATQTQDHMTNQTDDRTVLLESLRSQVEFSCRRSSSAGRRFTSRRTAARTRSSLSLPNA